MRQVREIQFDLYRIVSGREPIIYLQLATLSQAGEPIRLRRLGLRRLLSCYGHKKTETPASYISVLKCHKDGKWDVVLAGYESFDGSTNALSCRQVKHIKRKTRPSDLQEAGHTSVSL